MPFAKKSFRALLSLLCLVILLTERSFTVDLYASQMAPISSRAMKTPTELNDILRYVSSAWDHLTRSLSDCRTYPDSKTDVPPTLYLPADFPEPTGLRELQKRCSVRVEHLPWKVTAPANIDLTKILHHGLLYLENPYVVPGGQFNEMYGWDSYFIIRGLIRDGRLSLAKGMVENFFFELEHYGGVLNANRTYYLTRSQPPFLSSMILAVYGAEEAAGKSDVQWLAKAYRFAAMDYEQWTRDSHLAGDTGLSRYFDRGEGPVPEILGDPSHYYRGVAHYFLMHGGGSESLLLYGANGHAPSPAVGPSFVAFVCDPKSKQPTQSDCSSPDQVALSPDFYKGDRSMRESGFDVTFRFGPFGAETHHYAPVCLNSLLYKTETDMETISGLLGRKDDAELWKKRASERRKLVEKYMWDSSQGLFFDYNFVTHARSSYKYASTFYPLWAGLATKQQARALVQNLSLFEQPGGLAMSLHETGAQWDYPYGWAPVHLLAADGLRHYGYGKDADRIAYKFLSMVLQNFQRTKTIREKYDVVARSLVTHIEAGYSRNVIGFGWTNGVFLELLHDLPAALAARLGTEEEQPVEGDSKP